MLITFFLAFAEILQLPDAKQSKYGKAKFRESFSPDDITKSYLKHGAVY